MRTIALIAAYNAGKALPFVFSEIPRNLIEGIVVVDCSSNDGTMQAIKKAGVHVATETQALPGKAIQRGLDLVADYRPDVVVILDAYYRYFPAQVSRLIEPITEGGYDLVLGARPKNRFKSNSELLLRRLLKYYLNYSFAHSQLRLHDITPFRAVRFSAISQIPLASEDIGWLVEAPFRAFRQGFRICEVPVQFNQNFPEQPPPNFNEDSAIGLRKLIDAYHRYNNLLI